MSNAHVLLVEDDGDLSAMLVRLLTGEGYQVMSAADGQSGLHLGLTRPFDVLVLDRGLPAIEGLDLLGRLRRGGIRCPALVLSARGTTEERVAGLDAGAEDYLAKPFEVSELLARLRALLRRPGEQGEVRQLRGWLLHLTSRTALNHAGEQVELSEREAALLGLLAGRPQQVFTRSELVRLVFSEAENATVVDTYVHYCRKKLGRGVITTVRGLGYRIGR